MKIVLTIALTAFAALSVAQAFAQVRVDGYTKRNGTYVAPHIRSNPDGNRFNNYSTQGNFNPYTGRAGTRSYDNFGNYSGGSSTYGSSPRNGVGNICSTGLACNSLTPLN